MWIRDPFTKSYFPLGLDRRHRALLRGLQDREIQPAELTDSQVELLILTRILIPRRCQSGNEGFGFARLEARRSFHLHGFAIVRGLLNPAQTIGLGGYLQTMKREGFAQSSDFRACVVENVAAARAFGHELASIVSHVIKKNVTSADSPLLVEYQERERLHLHRDARHRSEFTVSIQLGQFPVSVPRASPWPLFIEDARKEGRMCAVVLDPGDGVVFLGRRLQHYRDALPRGARSSVLLLNYFRDRPAACRMAAGLRKRRRADT
jgi:hypothetical protein